VRGITPSTLYFSDRPQRIVGHISTTDFVDLASPPAPIAQAASSVYGSGFPLGTSLMAEVIETNGLTAHSARAVGSERFDRVPLLFGPSPVHRLERLSEHLGGDVDIWAKREDCNSGLAYGGNKVRKLEYLAADALAQGCDTLVSIGGVQSNHTRQVAAVAARLGLRCVLVQEHWVEWPDVVYDKVGNILLSRIMGADVRLDPAGFDIGIRRSWEDALASVEDSGGKPYAIPAGASDHPLGGLGFARWADEVAEQERELGVFFDTVVVCSVTGSTQAGMIAGFAAQDSERAVLGIDGSATVAQTRDQIARIARFTAEAIGLGRDLDDSEIVLLDEWHAGTYGIPDEKTIEAIRLCARLEGILTDPVYEGKSMAALIDLVRSERIASGSRVLYAHLGGQPALNAYAGVF
jgi:1-aminocyclopropane-1-carboxylate deaminase